MWRFFYLQKSDRRVISLLFAVVVVAFTLMFLTSKRGEDAPLQMAAKVKTPHGNHPKTRLPHGYVKTQPIELSVFDPNTADSSQLLRLGLKPWQVHNLMRYREAGGIFRKRSDFSRLYGLSKKQYQELEPYINIDEKRLPQDRYFYAYEPIEARDTVRYPLKIMPEERIVLNVADTTTLRKVPGIGSHFARKIVEYRQRLGGYYRVQQLLEIEDFPETAVAFFIIPDSTLPQRHLNINRLSLNELKRHPYINFYRARAITEYRRLHGRINDLRQLGLERDFTPADIERLEPYIEY